MVKKCFNNKACQQYQIFVVLVVGFCFCIYFGLNSMPIEMGEMIVTSSVFLAFLNLEKFKEFRGAGFVAKLKNATEEAKVTQADLEEVRRTAESRQKELEILIQKAKDEAESFAIATGS